MSEVNHTNPYTDEPFGDSLAYSRGRVAVVDGGEADAEDEVDEGEPGEDEETIRDVDHTPREGAPSTNEVYERGGEGTPEDEANGDEENGGDDEDAVEVSK